MEDSQDVDITILENDQHPRHSSDCSDTLPNFQFLDRHGAVQNSTDRPIEGFVALKLTYEYVFKKQQEKTRQLEQKNKQLAAENQLLKKESTSSRRHSSEMEQNASKLEDWTQASTEQKAGPHSARLSANTFSPSTATLQKLVSNYNQMNLIKCQKSEPGFEVQNFQTKDKIEREKSQDEDMYGPQGAVKEDEFLPYNLNRLHLKLMKLQEFPAKYQSIVERTSASMGNLSVGDTAEERSGCFVGFHNIKFPPTDLSKQAPGERDDSISPVMYYPESPATRKDFASSPKQDGNNSNPAQKIVAYPTHGIKQPWLGISEVDLSFDFEQARGPPTNKKSSVPDIYCVKSCTGSLVSSISSTPEVKGIDEKERERERDIIDGCIAIPVSNSSHGEQLMTAHSSLQCEAEDLPQVECPVCSEKFPTDTSEETATSHVNSHFDDELKDSHSFEFLDTQSIH